MKVFDFTWKEYIIKNIDWVNIQQRDIAYVLGLCDSQFDDQFYELPISEELI